MKYFSIPADFKNETIARYCELNDKYPASKVMETYGQLTDFDKLNSGRSRELLPAAGMEMLEKYVKYSRSRGIEFNYTLNPSCIGNYEMSKEGAKEICLLLERLYNAGVASLTVAMPSLLELVKATGLKFQLKASTICQISTPNKALFYKNRGVERIVLDEDVTRRFGNIKEIVKAFGDGVEIIVNSGCYKDCPYKMFHYNHESHTNQERLNTVTTYFYHRCTMQKMGSPENMIKLNWIRPEDLKYYAACGITHFKIQGRHSVLKGDPVKTLEHYFMESFDGNLADLLTLFTKYNSFQVYINNKNLDGFVQKFYDHHSFCMDNCQSCNYCKTYAQKSMDIENAERMSREVQDFYGSMDHYAKMLDEINSFKPSERLCDEENLDFGFRIV